MSLDISLESFVNMPAGLEPVSANLYGQSGVIQALAIGHVCPPFAVCMLMINEKSMHAVK
jgi:hypothetical protein